MYDRKFVLNNLLSTLQWEGGIHAELVHMSAASGNVKMLKSALKYAKSENIPMDILYHSTQCTEQMANHFQTSEAWMD